MDNKNVRSSLSGHVFFSGILFLISFVVFFAMRVNVEANSLQSVTGRVMQGKGQFTVATPSHSAKVYNGHNATVYGGARSVENGTAYMDPSKGDGPAKGYHFDHYYVHGSFNTNYSGYTVTSNTNWSSPGALSWSVGTFVPWNNVTVDVYFKPNTYTVKYDANGGSGSMSDSTATYDSGFRASTNKFTRTGYAFTGWKDSKGNTWSVNGSGVSYDRTWTYAENITLYAQWSVNKYQFDLNGVENHATADVYVNGVQVGYDVHDWYKKYDYGSVIEVKDIKPDPGYHVVGATYYKQTLGTNEWTCTINIQPNTYTVHYDGNDASNGSMPDQTATHNTDFTTQTNRFDAPVNKGAYVFDGWRSSQKCGGTDIWALTSYGVAESGKGPWKWTEPFADGTAITLKARWRYNVVFDPNTPQTVGSVKTDGMPTSASPLVCYYNEDQTLPANTYTAYGYQFVGWNTDKTASTALYTDGQTIKTNPTPDGGSTVTLYAIWKIDAYPITYKVQKDSDAEIDMPGTVSLANKKTVVYPAHGGLYFENPRLTNEKFIGWTCAELGNTEKTKDLTISSDQIKTWYQAKTDKHDNVGITLVAHFEAVPPFEFVDSKTGQTPILNETEKNQGKFRVEEVESSPGYIYEDQYHDIDIHDNDDTHEYQDSDYRNLTFPEKNGK